MLHMRSVFKAKDLAGGDAAPVQRRRVTRHEAMRGCHRGAPAAFVLWAGLMACRSQGARPGLVVEAGLAEAGLAEAGPSGRSDASATQGEDANGATPDGTTMSQAGDAWVADGAGSEGASRTEAGSSLDGGV